MKPSESVVHLIAFRVCFFISVLLGSLSTGIFSRPSRRKLAINRQETRQTQNRGQKARSQIRKWRWQMARHFFGDGLRESKKGVSSEILAVRPAPAKNSRRIWRRLFWADRTEVIGGAIFGVARELSWRSADDGGRPPLAVCSPIVSRGSSRTCVETANRCSGAKDERRGSVGLSLRGGG